MHDLAGLMTLLVELPAAEAQATAEALGYARVRAPAVDRVDDAPRRAQASNPTSPPRMPTEVPARTAETQRVKFWHVARHEVHASAVTPSDTVSDAVARRSKGDMQAMPPLEPFGEWARLWPRLYELIADRVPGRSPDVRAIVRDVSQGRPIESLPRLTIRRWPERLLLWADADEESVLLWPDRNALGARLTPLCGRLRFGGPDRWHPGESVLRLDAVPEHARAFGVRVESQGGRATALTLCKQRVPGWRGSAWTAAASGGDRTQRAHRLRVMLSAVGVVQPGLLRAVRALLPMSEADVQTELDVWRGPGVARRGVDGLMFTPADAETWRAEFARLPDDLQARIHQTVTDWRAHTPSELKHIESLLWTRLSAATPPLFDPAIARAFLDGVSRKMCGGRSKTLRVFARVASEQLLAFATPDNGLRAAVSRLWFAGHHGMAIDVPTQLDATQATAMLDPQEKQRDALRLSEGGIGLGGRKGVVLREVAWAHGAWKVAVNDGPLRQGDPTLRIPLTGREAITLSTGFERIELKTMQRPIWADSMMRDASGLHAEIEAMGLTLQWVVDGEGRWIGPGGVGVDEIGVFEDLHIANVPVRFRLIPAGTFMMGSPDDEEGRYSDEGPQHEVSLTEPFWLAEAAVTQALWKAVTGENPSRFKGADRPVERVSWDDVRQFIDKVEQSHPGFALQLPTEAQWEYACRAGTTTARYGELDAVAWHSGNSGAETHPVKQKQPNAWGLYDMLGNVYEWCADWKGSYQPGAVTNPTGPEEGSARVRRGGSWAVSARRVRVAFRNGDPPGIRHVYLGVRLSRGPAPSARSAERAEPASKHRSEPPARSDGAEGQARSAGGGASPEGSRPSEAPQTKRSIFSRGARRKKDES